MKGSLTIEYRDIEMTVFGSIDEPVKDTHDTPGTSPKIWVTSVFIGDADVKELLSETALEEITVIANELLDAGKYEEIKESHAYTF